MKWFITFLAATLAVIHCHGEISQVNTMQEVVEVFKEADQKTLALFDIDMVILQPQEPAFQMANMKRYSPIIKKVMQQIPGDKKDVFLILTTLNSGSVLIDGKMNSLLDDLTAKGVSKMALTGNFTGKFGNIESMEEWKIQRLKSHRIDFSKGAPHYKQIVFRNLPSYRDNYSTYTSGILFVNGSVCSKGEALIAFLKETGLKPEKVIFIDDREEHVKSVQACLEQFHPSIRFKGLHYTGAKDYPSQEISAEQFEARWQEVADQALKVQ
jgi:hypothetical protein